MTQSRSVRDNLSIFQRMQFLTPNKEIQNNHNTKDENFKSHCKNKNLNYEEEKSEREKLHSVYIHKEVEFSNKAKIYFSNKLK